MAAANAGVRSVMRTKAELKYWNSVWRKARRTEIELSKKHWCNYWHQHFDWDGRGNKSRREHRLHLKPLFHAFVRLQNELKNQSLPYQVFLSIHPKDTGSDALYVHTPNPHTDFPITFDELNFLDAVPPLLYGLINLDRHAVGVSGNGNEKVYTVIPKNLRLPSTRAE